MHDLTSFGPIPEIAQTSPAKIVLLVIDGLGGLPDPKTGKSEMETANKPNLNALAKRSALGLTDPVAMGITPGSGPGHLALFGYDPIAFQIKRGVMEALGVGLNLEKGEVAARGNFCTLASDGTIADRRAGRIPSAESAPLVKLLDTITLSDGVGVSVYPLKDHRYAAIFRGPGLLDEVSDTDPQRVGLAPLEVQPLAPGAERLAKAANEFSRKAREILSGQPRANMALLRGLSAMPNVPSMLDVFKLRAAAIAVYPMYRGLAKIVGMDLIEPHGPTLTDEAATAREVWDRYDFLFIHVKAADAAGEDGNFDAKVKVLEDVDRHLPAVLDLKPDVLMITGDHSTPSQLAAHSWHPVPFLLHSPHAGPGGVADFSERACSQGYLGRFPAKDSLPLAMANAFKLAKYGA